MKLTAEVNSLLVQLKKQEEKCTSLKSTLKDDMALISDLEQRMTHLKQSSSDLSSSYHSLETEHNALQSAFTALQTQHSSTLSHLSEVTGKLDTVSKEREAGGEGLLRLRRTSGGDLTPRSQFEELYDAVGAERQTFGSTSQHITELIRHVQVLFQSPPARTRTRRRTGAPSSIDTRTRVSAVAEAPLSPVISEASP